MKQYLFLFTIILSLFACKNDKTEVEIISLYPDGTTMKEFVYLWKGNKKNYIKEIRYFPNGQVESEGGLKDGKKDGAWISWYENGEKWMVENYVSDRREGEFIEWYMSGEKNYSGSYKNGLPDGEWIFWDNNGKKSKKVNYKDGQKIDEKIY